MGYFLLKHLLMVAFFVNCHASTERDDDNGATGGKAVAAAGGNARGGDAYHGGTHYHGTNPDHNTPLEDILRQFLNNKTLEVKRENLAKVAELKQTIQGRIHVLRNYPWPVDTDQITGLSIKWSAVTPLQEQEKQQIEDLLLALKGVPTLQTLSVKLEGSQGDIRSFAEVGLAWATMLGDRLKTLIDHCLDQLPHLITLNFQHCHLSNTDFQLIMETMSEERRHQVRSLKIYQGNTINFTEVFFNGIKTAFPHLVEIDVELNEFRWLLEKARTSSSASDESLRQNPHHMSPSAIKEVLTTISLHYQGVPVNIPLLWRKEMIAYVDEFFEYIVNEEAMGNFYCASTLAKISHLHRLLDRFDPSTQHHYRILEYLMMALKPLSLSEEKDDHQQSLLTKLARHFLFTDTQHPQKQATLSVLISAYPELGWEYLKSKFLSLLVPNSNVSYLLQSQTGIRGLIGPHYRQLYPAGRFEPEDSNHKGGFNIRNGKHVVGFLNDQSK